MTQDQAVLGWLATRPALPVLTRDLLIDVLIVLQALGPLPPITAEPRNGIVVNAGRLLEEIDQRLLQHPRHPDDLRAQAALADVHHLLGLARYSLLDPHGARAGRHRMEQHSSRFVQLRAREADTAVDLALADLRRERGQQHSRCHDSPAPGRPPPPWRRGPGRPRSGRSGPQSHNLLCDD